MSSDRHLENTPNVSEAATPTAVVEEKKVASDKVAEATQPAVVEEKKVASEKVAEATQPAVVDEKKVETDKVAEKPSQEDTLKVEAVEPASVTEEKKSEGLTLAQTVAK